MHLELWCSYTCIRQTFHGTNYYGMCWTVALQGFLCGYSNPLIAPNDYYTKFFRTQPSYNKTVAIISDSQCRVVGNIEGGHVSCVSQWCVVIINCGVNNAQLMDGDWKRDWSTFESELLELKQQAQSTTFIVSPPMDQPSVEAIQNYNEFIRSHLTGTGVQCLDVLNLSSNHLHRSDDSRNETLFEPPEHFHINHHGFRKLWNEWVLLDYRLMGINFKLLSRAEVTEKRRTGAFAKP